MALKILDPLWGSANDTDKERFRKEARILAGFRHPNIPSVYDVKFGDDGHFLIVFEYVHGNNLRELLKDGVLTLAEVQVCFGQIASALGHAHDKNIIHRDIKPENIIVTANRTHCYLVDFGIALSRACLMNPKS